MIRLTLVIFPLALAASGFVSAQHWNGVDSRYANSSSRWDTARVLSADPIFAPSEPRFMQQCWQEPVRYISRTRQGVGPNTGTVLGGIVGAAVGNQIGDGDGQRAATVAGALLGSAIARDGYLEREQRHGDGFGSRRGFERETIRYEQRCESVEVGRRENRVVGYRVTYDFHGHVFTTQTTRHPGRSLRVRVNVTPEI